MPDTERQRGRIVRVGTIDDAGVPQHWTFDCRGVDVASMRVELDGSVYYGGWTVDELRAYLTGGES